MGFKIIDLNNIINTLKIKSDVDINKMTFIELGEQEFKITYNDDDINENIRKFINSKPRSFKKNDERYSFFAKDYLNFIFKSVDSTDIECLCCYSFNIDLGRCIKIQHFYNTTDISSEDNLYKQDSDIITLLKSLYNIENLNSGIKFWIRKTLKLYLKSYTDNDLKFLKYLLLKDNIFKNFRGKKGEYKINPVFKC